MDISLHSTVRLLQRSDTSILMVSAASPACLCVRTNPQPYTSEYVRREFKSLQERRRDAGHGGGGGGKGAHSGGAKGVITPQAAIMNEGSACMQLLSYSSITYSLVTHLVE